MFSVTIFKENIHDSGSTSVKSFRHKSEHGQYYGPFEYAEKEETGENKKIKLAE